MIIIDCKKKEATKDEKQINIPPTLADVIDFLSKNNFQCNYDTLYGSLGIGNKSSGARKKKIKKSDKTKNPMHGWFDGIKKKYNTFKNKYEFPNFLSFYGQSNNKRVVLNKENIKIIPKDSEILSEESPINTAEVENWVSKNLTGKEPNYLNAVTYIDFLLTANNEGKIQFPIDKWILYVFYKVWARVGLYMDLVRFVRLAEVGNDEESSNEAKKIECKYRMIIHRFQNYEGSIAELKKELRKYFGELDEDIQNQTIEILEKANQSRTITPSEYNSLGDNLTAFEESVKTIVTNIEEKDMNVTKESLEKEIIEKLKQLLAPRLQLASFSTDILTFTKDCLPEDIEAARIYSEDANLFIKFDFTENHKPFDLKIYITPSASGEENVIWQGTRPELEYAYEHLLRIEQNQPYQIFDIGKLKSDSKIDLKTLFNMKRTKIVKLLQN